MHLVYGPAPYNADMRCTYCGALLQALTPPPPYADPVCRTPGKGGAGHDWLSVENPISNYFRSAIRSFWKAECAAYALEHPETVAQSGAELKPQDLPVVQLHSLKNKLVAVLRLKAGDLHDFAGFTVSLQFEKPPRKGKFRSVNQK